MKQPPVAKSIVAGAIDARPHGGDYRAVIAAVAIALSLSSFIYFYVNEMTNVYGDGLARLNIARKVVDHPDDSLWQRYIQVGSPWLPLPTILMLPLVSSDHLWRTGLAGSLLSMLSYVIASLAIYLHARLIYRREDEAYKAALPIFSAAIFMLNPSALYMQSTPMTELLFMATLASSAYLLRLWMAEQTAKRLIVAGVSMALAMLVRYEAWPAAALSAGVVALASRGGLALKLKHAALFSVMVAGGAAYWLWHNWAIYGNALEFLTGPYSARGIYLQNRGSLGWAKIFVGNFILDAALMVITAAVCIGPLLMILALAGLGRQAGRKGRAVIEDAPALLLMVPFLFHVLSLYRGEIQIFPLAAFGLLNVRYGLPHLLAVALFAPAAVPLFRRLGYRRAIAVAALIVMAQYGHLIWEGPSQLAVFQEGFRNGVNARPARVRAQLSEHFRERPPAKIVWMHTGALGPVVSQGGLRFSQIIHEGTAGWHQIKERIPDEVFTVVVQANDPVDKMLSADSALARDLEDNFEQIFSAGDVKVFERKGGS